MGNCLVLEEKEVMKIKRTVAKILKHQSPLKAHQALPSFPGDAIYSACPEVRHLNPVTDMQSGHLHYLQRPKMKQTEETGVVRIKLVISKQDLKEMLEKDGLSIEDMISQIQREKKSSHESQKMWRPALKSIPEINDLY